MIDLQALRKRRGLSQTALAKAIGVHRNTIARWERAEQEPRGLSLLALRAWIAKGTK